MLADLPKSGYVGFACASDTDRSLDGWDAWRVCPVDGRGQRAIRFKYDERVGWEGTKVAGHPVVLTLVLSDDAHVSGLIIETDPKARPFQRKKACLLVLQARSRYGAEDWACIQEKPRQDEAPIGDTFVKEECTKHLATKVVTVRRELYRDPKADISAFVGKTNISIQTTK